MQEEKVEDDDTEDLKTVLELARIARDDQGNYEMEVSFGKEEASLLHEMTTCQKNPGHKGFIPVKNFTIEQMPTFIGEDPLIFVALQFVSQCTVRIRVSHVSVVRPDHFPFYNYRGKRFARFGTGCAFVFSDEKTETLSCSKPKCKQCADKVPHHEYGYLYVSTAAHVVYDQSEGETAVIEFFYDNEEDRSNVITARVIETTFYSGELDRTQLKCVTDNPHLISKLATIRRKYEEQPYGGLCERFLPDPKRLTLVACIVSHPHGKSKHISIGAFGQGPPFDSHANDHQCYSTPTCQGSSGAPVLSFLDVNRSPPCCCLAVNHHSCLGETGFNEACIGGPSFLF